MEHASRPRRALVVINRHSRRGGLGAAVEEVLATLEQSGIVLARAFPADRAAIADLIRQHAARGTADCVVIGGGDGTLNAAALALAETRLPLGILPLGTANDLARTLDIPVDLPAAAAVIADGRVRRVDLGIVNGYPFFNVASIGLSVRLTRELTAERKRRWGRFAYAIAAIRALSQAQRPFSATIARDGSLPVHVKTLQIAVGNGRYYGGGMSVWEDARIDDQCLDLYSLEVKGVWRLVLMALALRKGKQRRWPGVRGSCGGALEVHTCRPRRVNADGEIVTRTPARFFLLPTAIQIYAPQRSVNDEGSGASEGHRDTWAFGGAT